MFSKILLVSMLFLGICNADVVYFNNGAVLKGVVENQNNQTLTINVDGQSTTYHMRDIKNVEVIKISPPPPPPTISQMPAATKDTVISAGTVINVVIRSTLSTQKHMAGHKFKAALDSDIILNGKVVASKGNDVYGVVIESKQAGRLVGKSSMLIELTALSINNIQVPIKTNRINAMNESGQGKNTAGKVARGAAIGGLADGRDGGKTGAKVGLAAAVLTRGNATGVPEGTLLDFTLTSNIKVP